MRFESLIFSLATRTAGAIVASYREGRFATEVAIEGDGDFFCFTTMLQGDLTLIQHGDPATCIASRGLALRPGHETRLMISDDSLRTNVFVKGAELERALEHMLDKPLSRPLLGWSDGLAASLKAQFDFVMREFERPDGIADNAVALATTTDLLIALILRAALHDHSAGHAVPAYLRRAEEFMRTQGEKPRHVSDIAVAAGCSVRNLSADFRQFRGRSPLAAWHGIRLDRVRRN